LVFCIGRILCIGCQRLLPRLDLVFGVNPNRPTFGIGFDEITDVQGSQVTGKGLGGSFVFQMADHPHNAQPQKVAQSPQENSKNSPSCPPLEQSSETTRFGYKEAER
jgi:hypothetical protein